MTGGGGVTCRRAASSATHEHDLHVGIIVVSEEIARIRVVGVDTNGRSSYEGDSDSDKGNEWLEESEEAEALDAERSRDRRRRAAVLLLS